MQQALTAIKTEASTLNLQSALSTQRTLKVAGRSVSTRPLPLMTEPNYTVGCTHKSIAMA